MRPIEAEDSMKRLKEVLPSNLLLLARRRHQERVQKVRSSGVDLGALVHETKLLSKKQLVCIKQLLPAKLSVRDFLDHTTEAGVREVALRLNQCAVCPASGGECQHSDRAGERPLWTERRPELGTPGFAWVACERWRPFLLDAQMLSWGFPRRLLRHRLNEFEPRDENQRLALVVLLDYVKQFAQLRGRGWNFLGGVGVGKTHLAVALVRELLERKLIGSACFVDCADLLAKLRLATDDVRRQLVAATESATILVLDDLGAHKSSDWVVEQLGLIINNRWRAELATVVTSNSSLHELCTSFGERTISRLQSSNIRIELAGDDYRLVAGVGGS